ncbi:MAG TPA: ATP-binding cassette domain-containing protein [Baekduia sp.]|nr:ATP-binding cassette domain-containing protein [Baekduia sp.]
MPSEYWRTRLRAAERSSPTRCRRSPTREGGTPIIAADTAKVPELLDRVGLPKRAARQRVKAYSLGMRQRLGIANALIGDPEVLILDEPANGLDPEGMRWMRGLLRDFADRGGTVLLSSHLLHEVEAVADQLLIIGNGKIVAAGTREELLAGAGTLVRATADHGDARLRRALDGFAIHAHPDGGFIVEAEPDDVGRAALAGGVALSRLGPSESAGLEQLFFDLTSEGAGDADDDAPAPPQTADLQETAR